MVFAMANRAPIIGDTKAFTVRSSKLGSLIPT